MGELIDLILDNLFLVIIIISGIVGFLSGDKEEQQKKRKPQQRKQQPRSRTARNHPSPPSTRQERRARESQVGNAQEILTTKLEPNEPDVIRTSSKLAEERARMEKQQEIVGDTNQAVVPRNFITEQDLTFSGSLQPIKEFTEEQEVLRKDIRKSLKGKRLINGIIMAEVLGKPRSLKPYESPTLERYKK